MRGHTVCARKGEQVYVLASRLLYILGSLCFIAGTLLAMKGDTSE